ncbi:sensor histidine kinase [Nonomuraea sp. NPDC048826]|uniref:sensor histidine kinase n=1 Tax=Nonomuraea sp. NPDC048826 TaxID=3364347 RepID=UPI00371E1356
MADDKIGPTLFRQRVRAASGWAPRARAWSAPRHATPHLAAWVLAGCTIGYLLITTMRVFGAGHDELPEVWLPIAVVAGATLVCLQRGDHAATRPRSWPRPVRRLALVAQAATTYLPSLWISPQFLTLIPLLAAACLLVLPGLVGKGLFLIVSTTLPLGYLVHGVETPGFLYDIGVALFTSLVIYGLISLRSVAPSVHDVRVRVAQRAVRRQRLQMAQDIHDLISHNLLVLTLKCELAHRLLPAAPHRAREVLGQALYWAGRARADARAVAQGCWHLSLSDELDSTTAVLASADIEVEVTASAGELPPQVDAVLAVALREAVTNLLRHSLARRCRVQVTVHTEKPGTVVRLVVANDGVVTGAAVAWAKGHGLHNLATRLSEAGGRLHLEGHDGWFVFTAEMPLGTAEARAARTRPESDESWLYGLWRDRARHLDLAGAWASRTIVVLLASVLLSHSVVSLAGGLVLRPSGPAAAALAGCVAVVLVIQIAHSAGRPRRRPWYARIASLSIQGAATFAPLVWLGAPWGGMAALFASSLLLLFTGWWRWVLYVVVSVAPAALAWDDPAELTVLTISGLLAGLAVYGLTRLALLVGEAHAARARLARAAVDHERRHLAESLHWLVERELPAIVARLEPARASLPARPAVSRRDIGIALDGARKVVAGVREMAVTHRRRSLSAEVSSAESVLTALGIEVETRLEREAGNPQDGVLAVALREIVVVLSHRSPRRCVIEVSACDGVLRLRVLDDAPPASSATEDPRLVDLRAVLEGVGGRLESDREDGWNRFTAEVPVG